MRLGFPSSLSNGWITHYMGSDRKHCIGEIGHDSGWLRWLRRWKTRQLIPVVLGRMLPHWVKVELNFDPSNQSSVKAVAGVYLRIASVILEIEYQEWSSTKVIILAVTVTVSKYDKTHKPRVCNLLNYLVELGAHTWLMLWKSQKTGNWFNVTKHSSDSWIPISWLVDASPKKSPKTPKIGWSCFSAHLVYPREIEHGT